MSSYVHLRPDKGKEAIFTTGILLSVSQYSRSTTYQIVAPASNMTGIRVKTLYMYIIMAGACALYADTCAPPSPPGYHKATHRVQLSDEHR